MSLFGNQAKTGFGTATTSGTGFGGFGAASTAAPATGFSFGATTTTASTAPKFGGFGTSSAPAASTTFSFPTASSSATTGFGGTGFGAPASTSSGFSFGTTTTSAPGFGGLTGFGGTTTTQAGGGFGFGTGTSTTGGLFGGAPNATAGQQQSLTSSAQLANLAAAVSLPIIFGDERDSIIAKWNQLQAYWGCGHGYFNQQEQYVDFTLSNPFCRFKAMGYSCIPRSENSDGLVAVMFSRKLSEIEEKQQAIVDTLQRICVEAIQKLPGNKPTISVCVEGLTPISTDKCQLLVYLQERTSTGLMRRIPATQTASLLTQPAVQSQLSSQLTVFNLLPFNGLSKEELKSYLDTTPDGVDPLLWQQVKLDNPSPERLLPVSMLGFSDLDHRLQLQQYTTLQHQRKLEEISEDISQLKHKRATTLAKLSEYKQRHLQLSHRVLQVLVKQEISRKQGFAIQVDEEQLRVQLEALQTQLNAPTQFKGRLNELMSQLRMQHQLGQQRTDAAYQMTPSAQQQVRQHLKHQQGGIQHLLSIIKDDMEDLKLIQQSLSSPASSI